MNELVPSAHHDPPEHSGRGEKIVHHANLKVPNLSARQVAWRLAVINVLDRIEARAWRATHTAVGAWVR